MHTQTPAWPEEDSEVDNSKNVCVNCGAEDEPVWHHEKGTVCHKCRLHLMNLAKLQLSRDLANSVHEATGLPTEDAARKALPIFDGVVMYFPLAMAAIAYVSKLGNDQHNPGEPLHWAREKSTDQRNTQLRHMIDAASGNPFDQDGGRHSAKAAWRALALLETEIAADGGRLFAEPVQTEPFIDRLLQAAGLDGTK